MHSVCVSSQLLVSVLFIAVPFNTDSLPMSAVPTFLGGEWSCLFPLVTNKVIVK